MIREEIGGGKKGRGALADRGPWGGPGKFNDFADPYELAYGKRVAKKKRGFWCSPPEGGTHRRGGFLGRGFEGGGVDYNTFTREGLRGGKSKEQQTGGGGKRRGSGPLAG